MPNSYLLIAASLALGAMQPSLAAAQQAAPRAAPNRAALLRSRPTRDAATGERAPAQVLQPGPAEAKTLQVDPPATGLEQEKAPLRVRLRVILGSAILLWALIALAVRALVAMIW